MERPSGGGGGGSSARTNNSHGHHQHRQHNNHQHHQQQQHNSQHRRPRRQEAGMDYICKVKYTNTLPDLPFQPKFLQSPFIALSRFVNYKPSTLEKNFKYELLTEPDLNVKIDLINPATYQLDSGEKPQMHPIDEQLLEDESVTQLNTKRSIQHRKVVPWMRKTEYISTEFNRYGVGGQGGETKVGFGSKNRVKDQPFEYKDRASQIAAIERTFEDAKKPIRKHYSRPGVKAVEEFQIFPDFDLWKFPFAQVIFDADPLPYCKTHRMEKLEYAILRGMSDSEGKSFVGYFSPQEETLEQRLADDRQEVGSYKPEHAYQYILEREYNWTVQNKASKGYEQENYFFTQRGSAFYYNELETRLKLTRRTKSASASKTTILSVTHRLPNSKELNQMNNRNKALYAIQEEEEIEDEEEEHHQAKDANDEVAAGGKEAVEGGGVAKADESDGEKEEAPKEDDEEDAGEEDEGKEGQQEEEGEGKRGEDASAANTTEETEEEEQEKQDERRMEEETSSSSGDEQQQQHQEEEGEEEERVETGIIHQTDDQPNDDEEKKKDAEESESSSEASSSEEEEESEEEGEEEDK